MLKYGLKPMSAQAVCAKHPPMPAVEAEAESQLEFGKLPMAC
jgi:hypothetical protein